MATTIRARIYARGEMGFAKFLFLPSWFAKLLEANFFLFCQNYMDAKLVCQTVGVALIEFKVSRPYGNYLQAAESESHTETKEDLSILTHNMNQPASFDVQTNVLEFSYTHVGYQEAPKFKLSLAAHGRRT
jgi:hypothetical protein